MTVNPVQCGTGECLQWCHLVLQMSQYLISDLTDCVTLSHFDKNLLQVYINLFLLLPEPTVIYHCSNLRKE